MRDEKESVIKQEGEIKEIIFNTKTRNLVRKVFLKELKKIIILKAEVYKNISVKEIESAKQAKIEDIVMPLFDGANYSSWKIRLMTLLESKECNGPATREITAAEKDKEAE